LRHLRVIWPWQDRGYGWSWLKAGTFALMFAPAIWIIDQLRTGEFGPVPLGGMTYWSGLWATALLLLALAITPAVTFLRWGRLIIVRRMIGVTALVYTLAHLIIYFALRLWDFSRIGREMVTRPSLILATAATLGLIALGATSLDVVVERMGVSWQRLHNTVYVVTALALIHYLLSPGIFPDQYFTCGIFFWLMSWRLLARRRLGADASALTVLAIVSTLFTALLEAGWVWVYQGYEPAGTLGANFSLELGVPAAWKMLVLGLAIALAAALRPARKRPPSFATQQAPDVSSRASG
jgi:methionine sulfoxide reductase heme-binding subunit